MKNGNFIDKVAEHKCNCKSFTLWFNLMLVILIFFCSPANLFKHLQFVGALFVGTICQAQSQLRLCCDELSLDFDFTLPPGWDNEICFVGTRGFFQIFRPNMRQLWTFKTILMDSTHQKCQ